MNAAHPSTILLFFSGLLIFWMLPLSSWAMLKGQRDRNAQIWFMGAWLYALVATSFVFVGLLPALVSGPLTALMSTASVLCFIEALRREISQRPTPWHLYSAVLLLEGALVVLLHEIGQFSVAGRTLHLGLIGLLDLLMVVLALRVRRQQGGRALYMVALVFAVFVVSNFARVLEVLLTGQFSELRSFSPVANFGLLTNYLGGIFYCYGYWGFVIEKTRTRQVEAAEQAVLAREREAMAQERERLTAQTLIERNALMERVASMGKLAQSGALSASLTHEFSQPLASMLLNVEQALAFAQANEPLNRVIPLLTRTHSETLRAAETLKRVKTMFQPAPLQLAPIAPDEVVRLVGALMESPLKQAGVVLRLELQGPPSVLFSPGELEHVLLNLMHNSLEAMTAARTPQACILIRTWQDGASWRLSLHDNGPGVVPTLADSLFAIGLSSKPGNMGLGLWLARFIMERHGGQIWLDPQADRVGAHFQICQPLQTV